MTKRKGKAMSQPDFEASQFRRRAADFAPAQSGSVCPCGQEMMALLQKMESDIREIKHGMGTVRTSFVRNDLGEPDYEGHRQAHIGMIKKHEAGERVKEASTLKVVGIVIAAVAAIFMSGMSVHIQKLLGG